MNLITLFKKFPNEKACIQYLEKMRWSEGVKCPFCNGSKVCKHETKTRSDRSAGRWQCWSCQKSFSITTNTIFHGTHLDLRYWFYIICLMLNAKKGLSACQVARDLDMRRPTAWAIMHRIRGAMQTEQKELLEGIFQMDETYIKSKKIKNEVKKEDDEDDNDPESGIRRENNTSVIAIKHKGGDIKAFVVNNTKSYTIARLVQENIMPSSEIHTDENKAYKFLKAFYNHKSVFHKKKFVNKAGVHCNDVESFWALLKRGVKGQFHHISKKYLQNYIYEFEYRLNNAENENVFSDVLERMLFKQS